MPLSASPSFSIEGKNATVTGISNPVAIGFIIGNESAGATVVAKIK